MIQFGYVGFAICVLTLSAFGLAACGPEGQPGYGSYGQAMHPSAEGYGGGYYNAHPSNIYKPNCKGGWDRCAYDSERHHADGNPN